MGPPYICVTHEVPMAKPVVTDEVVQHYYQPMGNPRMADGRYMSSLWVGRE